MNENHKWKCFLINQSEHLTDQVWKGTGVGPPLCNCCNQQPSYKISSFGVMEAQLRAP